MSYEFPSFDNVNQSRQNESFESRCVKQLNSVWLPDTPWSEIEKTCGTPVTYAEYLQHVTYDGEELPTIQFMGKSSAWKLELHDILCKDIKTYDFFKEWDKDEYWAIAFLCIGTPMVCVKSDYSLIYEISGMSMSIISKAYGNTDYGIMTVKDYARILKECATFSWQ